ncbi:trehalose operon transcriptional repressor [Listeria floridensis FSL S10-1187]|uniref:Trehalose operon repressor n=1 Tax=Listeria floridensis FSL S10-1187 TaxID=1265817 RepID=A0ABN0RCL7_9LIST|nr:trehalose operon repressor [Listeria floridensis]EUJ27392.1 trehalose operon transcriptional repressor [Listeria floridensis FSL S10-1187]
MNTKNKYYDIYLQLEERILNKTYAAGELIPSENLLAKEFHVSRETIRKALVLLLENGFIQKMQGKGSIVIDRERYAFPVSGLTSFKELHEAQHMNATTKVIKNEYEVLPERVRQYVSLPKGAKAWHIERVRSLSGEAVILDKDFLLEEKIRKVADHELENSLYEYLENELGYEISYAQKEFTVEPVTEEDRKWLDLKQDSHVVVVRSAVFLQDTTLFQYTESRHRLDRFRFIDFARRR